MLGGMRRQVNESRGLGGISGRLLAKNLSTLSTSAPAPSVRVGRSISRRGTCDRGIWTKPLAFAADAGEDGFCLGVSKFVHLQGGWMGAVSKVGWSFHSAWEAIKSGFCRRVSAGLEWVVGSGDTTVVGAQARAVESGMGSRSGRVKDWAPYGELPDMA